MKKLLFVAALFAASIANAQMSVSFGVGSLSEKSEVTALGFTTSNTESMPFVAIGFDYNLNLSGSFNFAPGIELSAAIDKVNDGKYKAFDFEIPLLFNYEFELGDVKLAPFAGPSIDLCMSSKWKSNNGNVEIDYYGDNSTAKHFGAGLTFGAWLDALDILRFKLGYTVGLTDWDDEANIKSTSNSFFIGVGYLF